MRRDQSHGVADQNSGVACFLRHYLTKTQSNQLSIASSSMAPKRTTKKSAISRASRTIAVGATSTAEAPLSNDSALRQNNISQDDATKTRRRKFNWFDGAYVSDDAYESDQSECCILRCLCTLSR